VSFWSEGVIQVIPFDGKGVMVIKKEAANIVLPPNEGNFHGYVGSQFFSMLFKCG